MSFRVWVNKHVPGRAIGAEGTGRSGNERETQAERRGREGKGIAFQQCKVFPKSLLVVALAGVQASSIELPVELTQPLPIL